jgi:hypothetical protein
VKQNVFCLSALLGFSALLVTAPQAVAAPLTFTLDSSACCGTGPFGTITLTQNGAGDVLFSEVLNAGIGFVKTGAGDAIAFSISGNPSISIANLTPGFAVDASPKSSPFGPFNYAIICTTACGNGGSAPFLGTLSFDILLPGLTPADFIKTAGYYFASDLIDANASGTPTGNVAASAVQPAATPEPASLLLCGFGLIGLGISRRRRRSS